MIIEQLNESNLFTNTEKIIVSYITQQPRSVILMSLQDICKECYASEASIIRFCKKLGTTGYSDFKIKLAQELAAFDNNQPAVSVDIPFEKEANMSEIAKKFYDLSCQSLEHTMQTLDFNAIEKAAKLLLASNTIHLFGRGESLILAEDFHYKLLRVGQNSVLESLQGFQEAYCRIPDKSNSDIALVISQYCNSQPTKYLLDELITTQTPFILVTAGKNIWPYNKLASVVIQISIQEKRNKMGSFSSRTAFLYALDCLYGKLFSLDYDSFQEKLTASSKRKSSRRDFYDEEINSKKTP